MATRIEIKHRLAVSTEVFWQRVLEDPEFNRALYLEELGFPVYEVLEERKDEQGRIHRKVKTVPKNEAPPAVRKVVGESFAYFEQGVFDPESKRYRFTISTSHMPDKVRIAGEMWAEAAGDRAIDRHVAIDLEVRVFGVGRLIESFVEKSLRDSYERAAAFTNTYAPAE